MFGSLLTDLIQRYASRKFLIPVGYAALGVYDVTNDLGLNIWWYLALGVLCVAFIIKEGEADIVERGQE